MIKRAKIFLAAAALALTAVPLGGCHGAAKTASFEVPAEFDTSRDYEITFWAKNDTNINQSKVYKQAAEDFHEMYPNITVNIRLYTDYVKMYNDVITNIATNTTPNVCISYPDNIATYMTGEDTVVPLDDLFSNSRYGLGGSEIKFDSVRFDEIIPQYIEECSIGGNYYALPYMRSTEACYINKTYVEQLGYTLPDVLTWDFVWEVSEAAAKKDENGIYALNGQKVMIPFIYKSTDNMMIQMLKQKNAGYSDSSGNISVFNDTTWEMLDTISKYTKKGAFSTFQISSYPANFLNAGQCIFAVDSTAGATWMGTDAPLCDIAEDKLVHFETAVMTVPQFDTENPKMISQGPSMCLFNKDDPQEVLASWIFMQYLISNDVQIPYSETEGYVPVTAKAQKDPQYLDYISKCGEDNNEHYAVKIKASELLMANTANTFVTPVFNGSASLRSASGQMIENVVKSTRRGEKIDGSYYDKLEADVISLYRLDMDGADANGRKTFGELDETAVILLISLVLAWVLIIAFVIINAIRNKRRIKKY